jgi:hypothetical protein
MAAGKLSLSYDRQFGRLTIDDGQAEPTIWHSTVLSRDALVELAEQVVKVLQGVDRAACAWAEEPGESRWLLERQGCDLQITVRWFNDAFSREPDERGRTILATVCPLRRFAVQIKNLLHDELEHALRAAAL